MKRRGFIQLLAAAAIARPRSTEFAARPVAIGLRRNGKPEMQASFLDAQFLESREFAVAEIARIFRLPAEAVESV